MVDLGESKMSEETDASGKSFILIFSSLTVISYTM